MARFNIPIGGISTTSAYEDGATHSLVNLRPKNGALHPVLPRKVLQELSQVYDTVFVHQGNDYEIWIGVIGNVVYWNIKTAPAVIATLTEAINGIEQIGNTLSLVTDSGVYYLYYKNGAYLFLGDVPQCPPFYFKTSTVMSYLKYHYEREYADGTITRDEDNFLEATKGLLNKAMDVLVNGGIDPDGDVIEEQGYQLFDACFVRYAFRLYDGTLTKHSPPILVMPVRNILDLKRLYYKFNSGGALGVTTSYVEVYGYRIYTWFDLTGFSDWTDIIESVDLFMSAPLGISQVDNIEDLPTATTETYYDRRAIDEITAAALKTVKNTSTFYLIKSFNLGTSASASSPYEFLSENEDVSSAENLIQQEVMSDDNFSNHKYGARVSYAYNNRLHISDIKTTFFTGFNPDYFLWRDSNVTTYGNYNGYKHADAPGPIWNSLLIEVEINTGLTNEKVYKGLYTSNASDTYRLFMSGFITYPDTRAKKLTIYRRSTAMWYKVFSVNLKEHDFLNLAYYLNDGLNPIVQTMDVVLMASPNSSTPVTIQEENKIKVSALSNPLSFPSANAYTAGTGDIYAIATNSMNVADRNYGQYPLYIFTTQGIWTLNVGSGEVIYSTLSSPTYPEAPTTKVICPTPYGVVFTGPRGLMLINDQSVELISPQLEQPPVALSIESPDQIAGIVHDPYQSSFLSYLADLDNIAYNPLESELIISDKDSDFNFVLNIPSKSFYRSTEKIDTIVRNTPSKLLVLKGYKLKDFSEAGSSVAHVSLITRPLAFGSQFIKNLERAVLRTMLYGLTTPVEGKAAVCVIHHSNDGVLFKGTRGLLLKPNNLKDIDMGLMGSVKFRQFLLSFGGLVEAGTEIRTIDALADNEYDNSKMR